MQFLASAPRGLADLLARELTALGAEEVRERSTGVAFAGDLSVAYRACLGSRIANRVFLELARFEATTADEFYTGARAVDWSSHLGPGATLACDFSGRHPEISHTHFGALKLKDAIVDSLRDSTGTRPDVALERPDVRVHAHAHGNTITVSLDLSGESLHRRGYRGAAGEAPLKENVAAGMLLRSGWAEMAAAGASFLDPMCGSGTIVIEAALIAADRAPGLSREYFGFFGWRGHDPSLWQEVRAAAQERARSGAARLDSVSIRGQDRDAVAVRMARDNAERAELPESVSFAPKALADAAPVDGAPPGLVCVNPPYGVRLEDRETARALHRQLGAVLRERFQGWTAAILTAPELGMELGIRAHRTHTVWNGAIECRLLRMKVEPASEREPGRFAKAASEYKESPGAKMFANRLGKNLKRLKSWVQRDDIGCYRAYDADMPEYAFAIDVYREADTANDWLYVQEYAAPAEIELDAVRRRRSEALSTLPDVTGVPPDRIRVRVRRRTKRGEQYVKVDEQAHFHVVRESGLSFRVNFDDYLDTGLFLDHRITRQRLRAAASGKRFLNLFGYTGTATVYAAAGGAAATTTVDLSRTYLEWAQRNLALNGLSGRQHQFIQVDCREWLRQSPSGSYELIFLDPPTFSNSKRMEGVLDVERDHEELIAECVRLLGPQGLLVFSTNAQKFKLDPKVAGRFSVSDISAATIPKDFERNARIHRCYEIRPLQGGAA
ncbi:MAG TPA: bifunctional 23S rRNA (guanine(2069)-N(7))-methyltransferase RlmK/23S rRNA (guanine(2445)-N(2))-methyltransferase RlmL [Steroidobacteraceae bacterium]|jgi:23S rRNA (guanine2445-N2)-methyltransferase / 23S rRNA (guanine2069-N7)-methyltransferase